MKFAFVNGRLIPESKALVSVLDRGFLYGDGIFETLRVYGGEPFAWNAHMQRLQHGARFLQMRLPIAGAKLKQAAVALIRKNRQPESVLRIQLSRGTGPRGYSPKGAIQPSLVMTIHDVPMHRKQCTLAVSALRLFSDDPLNGLKTCNKLLQIAARAEAERHGVTDALFLNQHKDVAETTAANVFWIKNGTLFTPPLSAGILPGITRKRLMRIAQDLGICCQEKTAKLETLVRADGVLLTSTVMEVTEVTRIDDCPTPLSPITTLLAAGYENAVRGNRATTR